MMPRKFKMTAERWKEVHAMLRVPLWEGFMRAVYLCTTCGQIQAHDFIPYGIGRGAQRNPCLCACVSSNWIHNEARRVAEKPAKKRVA